MKRITWTMVMLICASGIFFSAAGSVFAVTTQIAAGDDHNVGIKADGTLLAFGRNNSGQCDIGSWTDIIQLAPGYNQTVGLKSDGTAVAVGQNYFGECEVGSWTDIVQVAAGDTHSVGLKSDGTVVAAGNNAHNQCNIGAWSDIVKISAGGGYQDGITVGIKSDYTLAVAGNFSSSLVNTWTDIRQVAVGRYHMVGLKSDGTVVAAGSNNYSQCDVNSWTDITQVAAGNEHTVGLKSDGTVVAAGVNNDGNCNVGAWSNIIQITAGSYHTVGLKSDGTLVAVGSNDNGQCDISGLNLLETDGGYIVTSDLWIKTVLKPEWMGDVTLRWQLGGEDFSAVGDRTVWGYFYADKTDFPYGSRNNPEVFVKIYIATNGWCNIAFNHVTVDDVTVASAHHYAGTADKTGIVTLNSRLAEHQYDGVSLK